MTNCAAEVLAYMKRNGLVLATAESCTSGLIAAEIADVAGAGGCLDRAFVTYSEQAKIEMLGVRKVTIDEHNLTSEAVAREMAVGALKRSSANVAIANTGVVDAADATIPPGTQCFGWAFKLRDGTSFCVTERKLFEGDRRVIREESADYALSQLPIHHRTAHPNVVITIET